MIPEDKLQEFVKRVRDAGRENVVSVILYGSAVAGDFDEEFSNLNLFCMLRESSFSSLQALGAPAKWWERQKQPVPLIMSQQELLHSLDVFTIELIDMKRHHRVLFGEDALTGIQIPMKFHRAQVEYELREKLVLLRRHLAVASENSSCLWELMIRSISSFITLFRHALMVFDQPAELKRREVVQTLSKVVGFDAVPIQQVLDVREHKADPKKIAAQPVCAGYLAAIEKVTFAVDEALDSRE